MIYWNIGKYEKHERILFFSCFYILRGLLIMLRRSFLLITKSYESMGYTP